jgi:hypothetical protein
MEVEEWGYAKEEYTEGLPREMAGAGILVLLVRGLWECED